ncbi:MAG: DUF2202 domain-containing protein [Caldilineaceae bacterium]|nr:DUF2202 domain-containing protein [Caldilineaceae bacterium]
MKPMHLVTALVLAMFTLALATPTILAQGNGNGNGNGNGPGNGTGINAAVGGELTETESAELLYMREEEKMARDVYLTLGETWNLRVFENIAQSEQQHMDAILTLIERYGLEDPVQDNAIGVFENEELQALYDQLVEAGSQSVSGALTAGGAIEEIDILDLQNAIADTDNADVQQVYTSLLNGSYNHLRAFSVNLTSQTGETYVPQYMSADEYAAAVAGGGNGNRGNGNRNNGNAGQRWNNNGSGNTGQRGGHGAHGQGDCGNAGNMNGRSS